MESTTQATTSFAAICTLLAIGPNALKYIVTIFLYYAVVKMIDAFYIYRTAIDVMVAADEKAKEKIKVQNEAFQKISQTAAAAFTAFVLALCAMWDWALMSPMVEEFTKGGLFEGMSGLFPGELGIGVQYGIGKLKQIATILKGNADFVSLLLSTIVSDVVANKSHHIQTAL
jgi:hypothetical protein